MGLAAHHTASSALSARHRARWLSTSSWVSLRGEERVTGSEGAPAGARSTRFHALPGCSPRTKA